MGGVKFLWRRSCDRLHDGQAIEVKIELKRQRCIRNGRNVAVSAVMLPVHKIILRMSMMAHSTPKICQQRQTASGRQHSVKNNAEDRLA